MAKVQINYKSGNVVVLKCEHFKIVRRGGEITEVEWNDANPRPVYINVDAIESVWQL